MVNTGMSGTGPAEEWQRGSSSAERAARKATTGADSAPAETSFSTQHKSLQARLFHAMREPHEALQETAIFRNLTGAAPVRENLLTVTKYNLSLYLGVKAELDKEQTTGAVTERLDRRVTESIAALRRDLMSLGVSSSESDSIKPLDGIPAIESRGDVLVYSFMVEGSHFGNLAFRKKMKEAFGVHGRSGGGAEFMHTYRNKVTLVARGMMPLRSALKRVPNEQGEHAHMERVVHKLMHRIFEAFRDAPTVHAA